jgi:hypothetical protein
MTIIQRLQTAKLDPSPSTRSRSSSFTQGSFTVLDQIKRSAGSTPGTKAKGKVDTALSIHHSDTENGFVGFSSSLTQSLSANTTSSSEEGFVATQMGDTFSTDPAAFSLFTVNKQSSLSSDNTEDPRECRQDELEYHEEYEEEFTETEEEFTTDWSAFQNTVLMNEEKRKSAFRSLDTRTSTSSESSSKLEADYACSFPTNSWTDDGNQDVNSASLLDDEEEEEEEYDNDDDGRTTPGITDNDEEYDSQDEEDDYSTVDDGLGKPIAIVESFLDELAEVQDVKQLGSLLFQVGSCQFSGADDPYEEDEEEYTLPDDEEEQIIMFEAYAQHHCRSDTLPHEHFVDTLQQNWSAASDAIFSYGKNISSHTATSSTIGGTTTFDDATPTTTTNQHRTILEAMFSCTGI